jgi:dihydrofolate reductase
MRRLVAFNSVTLDGYFAGRDGDISSAKRNADEEFSAFVADNAESGGVLLFGRVTYELMASYWPTPFATGTSSCATSRPHKWAARRWRFTELYRASIGR